jgi:hypothetical protein
VARKAQATVAKEAVVQHQVRGEDAEQRPAQRHQQPARQACNSVMMCHVASDATVMEHWQLSVSLVNLMSALLASQGTHPKFQVLRTIPSAMSRQMPMPMVADSSVKVSTDIQMSLKYTPAQHCRDACTSNRIAAIKDKHTHPGKISSTALHYPAHEQPSTS